MIVDALLTALLVPVQAILDLLPSGHLTLPSMTGLTTVIAQLDSLIPIAGPLRIALGVLAAVVVFMAIRGVLVVVNIIWP